MLQKSREFYGSFLFPPNLSLPTAQHLRPCVVLLHQSFPAATVPEVSALFRSGKKSLQSSCTQKSIWKWFMKTEKNKEDNPRPFRSTLTPLQRKFTNGGICYGLEGYRCVLPSFDCSIGSQILKQHLPVGSCLNTEKPSGIMKIQLGVPRS